MEVINISKKSASKSKDSALNIPNESIEIAVIEDRKLINMLFSKTLHSAIDRIGNLKNFPVKFSSFQSGKAFLKDLENREFGKSKIIVFSDNNLEQELKNAESLFKIKQKGIDVTLIVMSDEAEESSLTEITNQSVQHLITNKNTNPTVSSKLIEKMVI